MMPRKHSRQEVLNFIIAYKRAHDGNSPSMRQVMDACAIPTTSLVARILSDLQAAGKINILPGKRGIVITGGKWTVDESKTEEVICQP